MLTDTKLRALKPRVRPYRVTDSHGLCIEVRPTGTKAWRYRYRYAGKPSIITLDEYPVMSLMQARIERDRLRSLLRVARTRLTLPAENGPHRWSDRVPLSVSSPRNY